jgi:Gpi18-like mannosyltransferase
MTNPHLNNAGDAPQAAGQAQHCAKHAPGSDLESTHLKVRRIFAGRFLWVYVAIVGSLLLRGSVLDFESNDYETFLSRWYDHFIEHGRLAGLKDDFSRYPLLYLYIVSLSTLLPIPKLYAIKLFSIVCDYVAAFYTFKIVRLKYPLGPLPYMAALGLLFLPTVWFNSAVWGQCDVMFAACLLATLLYLIVQRPLAAMVAFGIACALKPQAIFFVPLLAGWSLRYRIWIKYLAVPPLVYAVCGLPAMLAGKPVWEVIFRWAQHKNAPGGMKQLTWGATNWYQWIPNDYYNAFFQTGIVLAFIASLFLVLAIVKKLSLRVYSGSLSPSARERVCPHTASTAPAEVPSYATTLVTAALLSVLIVPYFLPGMHERYFYPADLLSLVYAFFIPRGWVVTLTVQCCSFFTYLPNLFNLEPVPRQWLALVMTAVLAWVLICFIKTLINPLESTLEVKSQE